MNEDQSHGFIPKHREIYNELHLAITEGRYQIGHRLPSDGSLMRKYKVSRPTVAHAMKDLENAGFVSRKAGSGTFVRTPPDASDAGLIGLLIPGLGETEIFDPICGEIARCCQKTGFNLLWGDRMSEGENTATAALALCQHYIDQRVRGVFFAPIELTSEMSTVNERITNKLEAAGIAIILLDRDLLPFPARSRFDLVGIDNFRAGYRQALHLLEVGCQCIVYIAKPYSAYTVDIRLAGYREAMRAHYIQPDAIHTLRGDPNDEAIFEQLLALKPDGIIAPNDATAIVVLRQLSQTELRVPEDVCVMGMDDVKYAHLLAVPLSTLHQPCRKIGAAAMQMMINRIESPMDAPRECRIDTHLIVRASTERKGGLNR
jgi:GntR family transcriptional regulator of arabinose operon